MNSGLAAAVSNIRDNTALSRLELDVEGATAFANYRRVARAVIPAEQGYG